MSGTMMVIGFTVGAIGFIVALGCASDGFWFEAGFATAISIAGFAAGFIGVGMAIQ